MLCDGTWLGRDTNTRSNIHVLARIIGIDMAGTPAEHTASQSNIRARYFDGVGLDGGFFNYIWNGALATQTKEECTEVYKYIVKNFAWNDQVRTEVWMFGISRGAYVVRSVAGMINNCGIIRDPTNDTLINQVYDLYRSVDEACHPSSPEMSQFRARVSFEAPTPIKFMGIFDTVGSRGIPKLNYDAGVGFEWPEFHDNHVSTAVEKVYHAVAIHDRLWAFQPCLASRRPRAPDEDPAPASHRIYQKWFPGCHYDLARQEFQFFREGGSLLERLSFPMLNAFSKTVSPNHKLADLVLIWMLEGIREENGGAIIRFSASGGALPPPAVDAVITSTRQRLLHQSPIGTGDMYEDIASYLPGGRLISAPLQWVRRLDDTAYAVLFKPADRVKPDPGINNASAAVRNEIYRYDVDNGDLEGNIIQDIAGVGVGRYPSQTYQNYIAYMQAVGRPP